MKFETTVPYTTPKRGPAAAVRGEGRPALQSWGRGEAAGVLPVTHCGSHCESECSPVSASLFPLYSWGGGRPLLLLVLASLLAMVAPKDWLHRNSTGDGTVTL